MYEKEAEHVKNLSLMLTARGIDLSGRADILEAIGGLIREEREAWKRAVQAFGDELLREGRREYQRERDARTAKSLRVIGRCLYRMCQIVEGESPLPYLGTRFFMGLFAEIDDPGEESTE